MPTKQRYWKNPEHNRVMNKKHHKKFRDKKKLIDPEWWKAQMDRLKSLKSKDGFIGNRWKALERDKFTCQYCGRKAPDVVLEVDHITPRSKGGTNDLNNLRTACHECNLGKSNSEIVEP